tara:strand:- start:2341 stop:3261 length:921 start_codon:yes stop_codon:yes gene_type:complete
MIQEDKRLIVLNSKYSIKNNGEYNSDVLFNFKNILIDTKEILYSTIAVASAIIPVSYYIITENNNALETNNGFIYLSNGNYNSNSFIVEITEKLVNIGFVGIIVTININNGILTFEYASPFSFFISSLFSIIGLKSNITSINNVIICTYPLNLLGNQHLNINSNALITNNYNSDILGDGQLLNSILCNAPPYGIIEYVNINNFSILKNKNISIIDIKIYDDNNLLLNFQSIDWAITLELTIYRKLKENNNLNPFDNTLKFDKENDKNENDKNENDKNKNDKNENDKENKNKNDEDDLDVINYNNNS